MPQPYFLIVLGPPASGKGSLPEKVKQYLNLDSKPAVKVLIDDLVENSPYYKKKFNEWIQDKTETQIQREFRSPTKKTLNEFNDMYFTARKFTNCKTGTSIKEKPKSNGTPLKGTCDYINNKKLENAIKYKKNVIFETKGEYFPQWLFDIHDLSMYHVINAWSVVDLCKLLDRNKSRARQHVSNYLNNTIISDKLPPRLPNLKLSVYASGLRKTIETFKTTLKKKNILCGVDIDGTKCNEMRLLVFNNNSLKPSLEPVYDSKKGNLKNINVEELRGLKAIKPYNVHKKCTKKIKSKKSNKTKKSNKKSNKTKKSNKK